MEINPDLIHKTCATCKSKLLSSYVKVCVECLKKDKPGNRFPNWEKANE